MVVGVVTNQFAFFSSQCIVHWAVITKEHVLHTTHATAQLNGPVLIVPLVSSAFGIVPLDTLQVLAYSMLSTIDSPVFSFQPSVC